GSRLLQLPEAPELLLQALLVEHAEDLDDEVAAQGGPPRLGGAAEEEVARKERQAGDERPPGAPGPLLGLRQVEPHPVAGEMARQSLLLPAAHVGHPPGVLVPGQLEQVRGEEIDFWLQDRHVGCGTPGSGGLGDENAAELLQKKELKARRMPGSAYRRAAFRCF